MPPICTVHLILVTTSCRSHLMSTIESLNTRIFSHISPEFQPTAPVAITNHSRRTWCETTMFAAASSFFARPNIFQNYNVGGSTSIVGSRSVTPAQGSSSNPGALPTPANTPAFFVGPWKVQSGSHKTTNKRVSVWTFDKRSPELEKMGPAGKERTFEVLKSEVRATLSYGDPLDFVFTLDVFRPHLCRD